MIKTIGRLRWASAGEARSSSIITDQQRREWAAVPAAVPGFCDALVIGGGLSSCAAALTLARAGHSVIIVEPTHMVGGQATAAGVSAFDITFHYDHALNDYGIWGEIVGRLIALYRDELGRPLNVGHYSNNSITPNVCAVERVLTELLSEAGVLVLRNTTVKGLTVVGGKVTSASTSAGDVRVRIVLDGSEGGKGASLAGAAYYIGNSVAGGDRPEAAPAATSNIQDITYTCMIRRYPEGIPEELKLRQVPPGYEELLETLREHYPPDGGMDPHLRKPGPHGFAGYRAAPDLSASRTHLGSDWEKVTRTSLNFKNDTSTSSRFLDDVQVEEETNKRSIYKTLGILYYLQNELDLDWAVCTDEGFADGPLHPAVELVDGEFHDVVKHFPPMPYMREACRIVGTRTLTGQRIWRPGNRTLATWDVQSVAMGTYPPDLHGGREPEDLEGHLNETIEDKPDRWREGPFPIPLGCLIPTETDAYIALEKNISASRIAAAAIRVHPTATAVGQAGGTLAAISLQRNLQPREVPPTVVQWLLARDGALITPLAIKGLDSTSPDYAAIAFAIVRAKVPWTVSRVAGAEPKIDTDLDEALKAGSRSAAYLDRWLSSAPRPG